MLFLDHTQVKYCKLQRNDKIVSGIIYNGVIFTRSKAFAREELEAAIKECREEYLDHPERSQIPTLLIKGKNNVGIWMENKHYKKDHVIETSATEKSSSDNNKSSTDINRISIRNIAAQMQSDKELEIKTRRYKLKLHQRCFLGNEAVDWIAKKAKVSRLDAIKIGQKMLDKGIFTYVTHEYSFKDENLFYRFSEDK